jgi:hypothetical protein
LHCLLSTARLYVVNHFYIPVYDTHSTLIYTETGDVFTVSVRITRVDLTGGRNLKRRFLAIMTTALLLATVLFAGCVISTTQNNTTMNNASKTAPVSAASTGPIVTSTSPFSANQLRTELTLTAPTTAKVNEEIPVSGTLICVNCKEGINGALIHDQQWNPDISKWITFGSAYTTDEKGIFHHTFTARAAGTYYFRVTFDGDSQYVHAASNVVTVTVN